MVERGGDGGHGPAGAAAAAVAVDNHGGILKQGASADGSRQRRKRSGKGGGKGGRAGKAAKRAAFSCGVCHDGAGTYRCPKCGTRYCSVKCYKAHAPKCTDGPKRPLVGRRVVGEDGVPLKDEEARQASQEAGKSGERGSEEEQEDGRRIVVSQAQLAKLKADPELRSALRDPKLQAIIRAIDSAGKTYDKVLDRDRVRALERAKKDPQFSRFIDDMMKLTGLCEQDASGKVFFTG